ncbi:IclR family transcriptional regulator [Oceanobacillus manasiensis]|uniref:IclR family transcriptional regulator n=1 Tax=Oceanobacillus manasiensis TaxID=586413 RepID=UPI0005A622F2|nr:IclR family transcriptional regulator [Oceanobacillus manasiensis]
MAQNEVSTLKKGLLVLEMVKQRKGITLKEVMHELNLSKSTAFRILSTLEEMEYVYKLQTQYFVHHKMFCESFEKRSEMDWASLHSIYQVANKMQMSTYVGKMDGNNLVMTQALHAPFQRSAEAEIGNRSKLHQTAIGKVILAHLKEDSLTYYLGKTSLGQSTNTFHDPHLFRYHLKAIRDEGYAFDDEERIVGARCLAVPIFRNQEVIAALSVAAPVGQISCGDIKHIAKKLHVGSKAITKEIETFIND